METIPGPGNSSIESRPSTLLLVDDEENILAALRRLLRRDAYQILCAGSGAEGLELLAHEEVDLILSDQRMPHMLGTEFLAKARERSPHSVRMILSGYTDLESVTAAINDGAVYKFLTKPWDDDILRLSIKEALRYKWVQDENRLLQGMLLEMNDELAQANRQLAERADFAQETLQHLQQILHCLPVPLLGVDGLGMLAFANQAALDLLGAGLHVCQPAASVLPASLNAALACGPGSESRLEINARPYRVQVQSLGSQAQGYIVALIHGDKA